MRTVTVTEKYNAVLEGRMNKKEFVRQMRQEYPMFISNYDGFDSTVSILKTRNMLFEAPKKAFENVKVYDDRPALTYSLDALDRGIRAELHSLGIELPHEGVTPEDYLKAEKKAKGNLEKNPNHYLDLMSGESSNVDKHDREVEIKRGEGKVDTFNDLKKATLKEGYTEEQINSAIERIKEKKEAEKKNLPKSFADQEKDQIEKDAMKAKGMIKEDPVENVKAVAKIIRDEYGQIPGFTKILRDFLFTHQDEIKAGIVKPEDALAEFDNYIDANYDRLDEKEEEVNEGRGDLDRIISIIQDHAADYDGDELGAAEEIIEAIGDHYGMSITIRHIDVSEPKENKLEAKGKDHDGDGDIDSDDYMAAKDKAIKKAMGKEEQLKEAIKSIIKKTLNDDMLNEAATQELARIADDYAGFEGMKSAILDLENIVTDIEKYYDNTRNKIQKVYDRLGEIRNEEGLKVGGFLAPAIESAFHKDLRPVTKQGFTKGLETPKVKTLSQADIDAARAAGDIEEEPKQTMFTPVNENKK